jgi:hypothetical protein
MRIDYLMSQYSMLLCCSMNEVKTNTSVYNYIIGGPVVKVWD